MKTLKKAVVLLTVLPFMYATVFGLDYFDVGKPNIKKAGIYVTSEKNTAKNRQFIAQIRNMLEGSLLFNSVSNTKSADYSITLGKSIEDNVLEITIKGEKQGTFKEKYFGLRFKNSNTSYINRKAAQIANRITKELFGAPGALGSSITWSVTDGSRKVIYMQFFRIPDSTRQVTHNFYSNYGVSWNRSKDYVIYTSHTDYGTVINLQRINPLLFKAFEIYSQSGKASSPIWAPDGSVYMTLHVSDQNSDIFKFTLTGAVGSDSSVSLKKVRQMTHIPSIETEPAISPDGRYMAYVSDQTSEPQIYLLDLNTQKSRRITRRGGYNVSPSWAPNGRHLAYRSIRQGISSIYRLTIETGEEKRLTPTRIQAEDPTWSPDGSLVAFTAKNGKNASKIFYVLSSGGEYKRLTNTPANVEESSPSWGPSLR